MLSKTYFDLLNLGFHENYTNSEYWDYKIIEEKKPNWATLHNNKGIVLENIGDIKGSRNSFLKAISINPE